METSAENRRISQLVADIGSGRLIPQPDFQRKLVWSNKDKIGFLETVLASLPFPEIYLATGEVDLETGIGSELLVDGQQRVTTLHQYFTGADLLKLPSEIHPYKSLSDDEKKKFLNYQVAVRNLGIAPIEKIRDIFQRINSTSYALNAMEVNHAKYRGPFKQFVARLAKRQFFSKHHVFSPSDVRRMRDEVYVLTIIITMMSSYFNRNEELEAYLERYNDEFEEENEMRARFVETEEFIQRCGFEDGSRVWQKMDLFTLFIEVDRILHFDKTPLYPGDAGMFVNDFYGALYSLDEGGSVRGSGPFVKLAKDYRRASTQSINDKANRVLRGRVIRTILNMSTAR